MPEISTGCLLSVMFVDIIRASIHDRDKMMPETEVKATVQKVLDEVRRLKRRRWTATRFLPS